MLGLFLSGAGALLTVALFILECFAIVFIPPVIPATILSYLSDSDERIPKRLGITKNTDNESVGIEVFFLAYEKALDIWFISLGAFLITCLLGYVLTI